MSGEPGAAYSDRRGLFFLIVSAVLWGTVPVATNVIYGLAETNPLSIGFFRLALSLILLVPATLRETGRQHWRLPRRDLAIILLFGIATALYQVCFFAAIPRVGVTVTSLVAICTAPVIVTVLGALLLGEHLTGKILLALAAAITGTVLLVGVRPPAPGDSQQLLSGLLLALGAALSYATVTLCSRALTGRYRALQLVAIGMGSGALVLLPFALLTGLVVHYPPAGWALLLHLGLLPTALAYLFFFYGLRFTPVTVATIVILLEPLTSTILAWLLFGERLGALGIVGAALVLGAMALLYLRPGS